MKNAPKAATATVTVGMARCCCDMYHMRSKQRAKQPTPPSEVYSRLCRRVLALTDHVLKTVSRVSSKLMNSSTSAM